jgi:hypothetical protein
VTPDVRAPSPIVAVGISGGRFVGSQKVGETATPAARARGVTQLQYLIVMFLK